MICRVSVVVQSSHTSTERFATDVVVEQLPLLYVSLRYAVGTVAGVVAVRPAVAITYSNDL